MLYTDYILMKREMPMVLAGIQAVIWSLNIKRALFCVKEHTAARLSMQDGEVLGKNIFVKILPNVYPIGDEVSLIYQSTGRIVRPGNLPISQGVIVYNVETVYNIANAIGSNAPVTTKWVTVGGAIANPTVIKVPVGSKVSDIFAALFLDGTHLDFSFG